MSQPKWISAWRKIKCLNKIYLGVGWGGGKNLDYKIGQTVTSSIFTFSDAIKNPEHWSFQNHKKNLC